MSSITHNSIETEEVIKALRTQLVECQKERDAELQRRWDGNRIASDEWREECLEYEARIAELVEELANEIEDRCGSEAAVVRKCYTNPDNLSALNEYRNKVIEECAKICEKSDRYRGDYFAAKIRTLKKEE